MKHHGPFKLGPWQVEPQLNRLRRDSESRIVEPRVMAVLTFLAENHGAVVDRDLIREHVWEGVHVSEGVVRRVVSKVRKALDDPSKNPLFIETVSKQGYRLLIPPEWPKPAEQVLPVGTPAVAIEVPAAQALPELKPTQDEREDSARGKQRVTGLGLILGLALVSLVLLWRRSGNEPETEDRRPTAPPLARTEVVPLSSMPGHERHPTYAPDGLRLAFCANGAAGSEYHIYETDLATRETVQITHGSGSDLAPAYAPDGKRLIFTRYAAEGNALMIKDLTTQAPPRALSLDGFALGAADWSPLGEVIVYTAAQGPDDVFTLYLIDLTGGESQALAPIPREQHDQFLGDLYPKFSPNGEQVAFIRARLGAGRQLMTVDLKTGETVSLVADLSPIRGFDWSPDGRYLIYSLDQQGLWTMDLASRRAFPLPESAHDSMAPAVSPKGFEVVVQRERAVVDIVRRTMVDEEATPLVVSSFADWGAVASPAGDRLAFISDRGGRPGVWIQDTDGVRPLTRDSRFIAFSPVWSPDGERLALVGRSDGDVNLYWAPHQGGVLSSLQRPDSQEYFPLWSPDGRWIYFTTNEQGRWRTARVDWRRPTVVEPVADVYHGWPGPRGEMLYFTKPGQAGLWRRPLQGGDDVQVVPDLPPGIETWWVTAGAVYYPRGSASGTLMLAVHDEQTGTTRDLLPLLNGPRGDSFSVSSDGTQILLSQPVDFSGDLFLFRGLNWMR